MYYKKPKSLNCIGGENSKYEAKLIHTRGWFFNNSVVLFKAYLQNAVTKIEEKRK